jgi:hypothetical protein
MNLLFTKWSRLVDHLNGLVLGCTVSTKIDHLNTRLVRYLDVNSRWDSIKDAQKGCAVKLIQCNKKTHTLN